MENRLRYTFAALLGAGFLLAGTLAFAGDINSELDAAGARTAAEAALSAAEMGRYGHA